MNGNQGKRPLVILGNGPTMKYGREIAQQLRCECWGINYMIWPELTLMFQMHGDSFVRARFLRHYRAYPPKVPVMMHHRWHEIPTSTPYPMRQYGDEFGLNTHALVDMPMKGDTPKGLAPRGPYTSCTMSYMLALAHLMGCYDTLYIYGIDLYYELRHESEFERPCVEFHMGWLLARGYRLVIPEDCRLMTTEKNPRMLYGAEWNPALRLDEIELANAEGEKEYGVIRHEDTPQTQQVAAAAPAGDSGLDHTSGHPAS